MYGYIFAAAEIGLRHSIRDDVLLTPGYPPRYEPTLLRYDQWCKFGDKHFNKLSYKSGFNIQNCKQYFPIPPDLQLLDTTDLEQLGTELICVEQVTVLNEALCEYHKRMCGTFETVSFGCHQMRPWKRGVQTAEGCERSCSDRGGMCSHFVFDESEPDGPCFHTRKRFRRGECADGSYPLEGKAIAKKKKAQELTCPDPAWNDVQRMQDEYNVLGFAPDCVDTEPACLDWEARGECVSNPKYMRRVCPNTCRVEGCWDKHFNCRAWAESGQCEENFQYMVETCPVICRERRAQIAKERASQDAGRLQLLKDAREQEDADAKAEAALAEEAPDPDDDEGQQAQVVSEEEFEFKPARAVVKDAPPAPKSPEAHRTTSAETAEEELEVAWGRVALAAFGGALCVASICWGLPRLYRTRKVHVTAKEV